MKCEICREGFTQEITFATLFSPIRICPSCQKQYKPGWFFERIPVADGYFDYASIYDFGNPDYRQGIWLFKNMDKCFNLAICSESEYDLKLCVDGGEFETAEAWIPLVLPYRKVLLFSLFYFDFMPFEDLM